MSDPQSSTAKRAEIEFRRKLFEQQVEGQTIFSDEFDGKGIEAILGERMEETLRQMRSLRETGVPLSPYLEIGAERCQRSLVMENDLGAAGAAVDISFDMLRSGAHYAKVFKKSNVPLRVCCDANVMPFLTGSMPFVFCFEVLHHFPDPTPIIAQIHRVLAPGGCFFFAEEPYRQVLRVKLYRSGKIYSRETLRASKIKRLLDRFFAEPRCNEVEHGIIENHDIPLSVWKNALAAFSGKRVTLSSARVIQTGLYPLRNPLKYFAAKMLGGVLSGTCTKAGAFAAIACTGPTESGLSRMP
ncbi:MAG: class I SAM-dependent methyltransferase [Ignavibacteriae bacterium]|nr:class I SAM-dependent methyltransferase [Ignavibacteriota bacterium]